MHGDGEIAHGVAADPSPRYESIPPVKIPSQRRKAIKRRYRKREYQLADDGYRKPKPRGCFQDAVSKRIQLQSLVGHYCCTHGRFSLSSPTFRLGDALIVVFVIFRPAQAGAA
jgi:hypothetical protein